MSFSYQNVGFVLVFVDFTYGRHLWDSMYVDRLCVCVCESYEQLETRESKSGRTKNSLGFERVRL